MSEHSMMPVGDTPIIVVRDNPKTVVRLFEDKQQAVLTTTLSVALSTRLLVYLLLYSLLIYPLLYSLFYS